MNLHQEIEKAARAVAFEWPGVIDSEEAAQEIWVKLLESKNYVSQIERMNDAQRTAALRRIGHQIASRHRADYDRFTGNVYYGSREVRKRLESGLLAAAYEETESGAETLTEYLDITEGLQLLKERSPQHADVLVSRFIYGEYNAESGTARRTMSRAIAALTEKMNQVHRRRHAAYVDGPGSRRAMSNENALKLKLMEWHGDDLSEGRR